MNKKTVFAGLMVSALMLSSCQSMHQLVACSAQQLAV